MPRNWGLCKRPGLRCYERTVPGRCQFALIGFLVLGVILIPWLLF